MDIITEAKKWIKTNGQPKNFEGVWPVALMTDLLAKLEEKEREVERQQALHLERTKFTHEIILERDALKAENEKLVKEINELKKKRTKGEINEAYAKTIEANKDEISKLKVKANKLTQKAEKELKSKDIKYMFYLENKIVELKAENEKLVRVVDSSLSTIEIMMLVMLCQANAIGIPRKLLKMHKPESKALQFNPRDMPTKEDMQLFQEAAINSLHKEKE